MLWRGLNYVCHGIVEMTQNGSKKIKIFSKIILTSPKYFGSIEGQGTNLLPMRFHPIVGVILAACLRCVKCTKFGFFTPPERELAWISTRKTRHKLHHSTLYRNLGCRVWKRGIQNWINFWAKINILIGNYCILSKSDNSFFKTIPKFWQIGAMSIHKIKLFP